MLSRAWVDPEIWVTDGTKCHCLSICISICVERKKGRKKVTPLLSIGLGRGGGGGGGGTNADMDILSVRPK